MKTSKNIRINCIQIPAGTVLQFSMEGYCTYKGVELAEADIISLDKPVQEAEPLPETISFMAPDLTQVCAKLSDAGIAIVHDDDYNEHHNDYRIVVKLPEDVQGMKRLCNVLTEIGMSGDQICISLPTLAIMSGLATPEYCEMKQHDYGYDTHNGNLLVGDITLNW